MKIGERGDSGGTLDQGTTNIREDARFGVSVPSSGVVVAAIVFLHTCVCLSRRRIVTLGAPLVRLRLHGQASIPRGETGDIMTG